MSKGKVENIKDKIDGNEVDLSLSDLTEVPVKELVSVARFLQFSISFNQPALKPDNLYLVRSSY